MFIQIADEYVNINHIVKFEVVASKSSPGEKVTLVHLTSGDTVCVEESGAYELLQSLSANNLYIE